MSKQSRKEIERKGQRSYKGPALLRTQPNFWAAFAHQRSHKGPALLSKLLGRRPTVDDEDEDDE